MTKKNLKSKTLIKIYIIQTCRECFLKSLDFGIFPQFHDTSNYKMYYQCNNHFSGGGGEREPSHIKYTLSYKKSMSENIKM